MTKTGTKAGDVTGFGDRPRDFLFKDSTLLWGKGAKQVEEVEEHHGPGTSLLQCSPSASRMGPVRAWVTGKWTLASRFSS